MTLQNQIGALRNDIGKPRITRGRKVRAAAIRFEEHFRGEVFSTSQFKDWLATEPTLQPFTGLPALAMQRLQAAGYRDDMPRPFEIKRVAKSAWKLRAVEDLLLSGDIPESVVKFFQKLERRLQHALQACDLDDQDRFRQFTIVALYGQFKRCKQSALIGVSGMQDVILQLANSADYLPLGLENKTE